MLGVLRLCVRVNHKYHGKTLKHVWEYHVSRTSRRKSLFSRMWLLMQNLINIPSQQYHNFQRHRAVCVMRFSAELSESETTKYTRKVHRYAEAQASKPSPEGRTIPLLAGGLWRRRLTLWVPCAKSFALLFALTRTCGKHALSCSSKKQVAQPWSY